MKPVYQTTFKTEGNCFSACIASILEIDLDKLPKIDNKDLDNWSASTKEYLEKNYNLSFFFSDSNFRPKGYYILSGTTERNPKLNHAVICLDSDDNIVHDPLPKGSGKIVKFLDVTVFYKIFKENT